MIKPRQIKPIIKPIIRPKKITKLIETTTEQITNKYEIKIIATSRSGHHGIITWLAYHFTKPVIYLNDVDIIGNPYLTAAHQDEGTFDTLAKYNCYRILNQNQLIALSKTPKLCLIYNYEDRDIRSIPNNEIYVGKSEKVINILILRDPYNTIASILKSKDPAKLQNIQNILVLWSEYAKEFLGITSYLPNKVVINYNNWFKNKKYRQQISTNLGLIHTDMGLNSVAPIGGGSSFDGTNLDGQAQKMDVLNRWKGIKNPKFLEYFTTETHILSQRIFGEILPRNTT